MKRKQHYANFSGSLYPQGSKRKACGRVTGM
jgi:hypothetical protein